ncbi:class I SAM-dependent methyltransferase [Sciscionella sediminilitoris]|uniref:class I SAM-dependent methyltransferase n=1 Tax=Sciscionella sediminilitoris TaxID=1445613 RepID=UPI0007C7F77E|nr:methyltransferase domain-containing protein [Sciscionella sp. SE31]
MTARADDAMATVLELLREPPAEPDTGSGYLDLLGSTESAAGPVQRLWESGPGASGYERLAALVRTVFPAVRPRVGELRLTGGQRVLDIGTGPGQVTGELARLVGPRGLVVGLDLSVPMLRRAAGTAAPNTAFVRADATGLPFRDAVFDAVHSAYTIQLVREGAAMLAEMARVLRPGGRLCVLAPGVARPNERVRGGLERSGKLWLRPAAELAELAREAGLSEVRGSSHMVSQLVTASRPR